MYFNAYNGTVSLWKLKKRWLKLSYEGKSLITVQVHSEYSAPNFNQKLTLKNAWIPKQKLRVLVLNINKHLILCINFRFHILLQEATPTSAKHGNFSSCREWLGSGNCCPPPRLVTSMPTVYMAHLFSSLKVIFITRLSFSCCCKTWR